MKRLVLTIAILLGLAAPAWAGLAEGLAAFERRDYATALREWRSLANQGNASAQYNVGLMYDNGQGVPQDYVQAHMWFNLAASRTLPGTDRDNSAKGRDIIAKRMTPADVSKAQRLAREWKPKK